MDFLSSKVHLSEEDMASWSEACVDMRRSYVENLPWAEENNQLHQLTAHGHEFINNPRIKSLGLLTLEGLEGGNYFFNKVNMLS